MNLNCSTMCQVAFPNQILHKPLTFCKVLPQKASAMAGADANAHSQNANRTKATEQESMPVATLPWSYTAQPETPDPKPV